MKVRKRITIILAVLPPILLAAGFTTELFLHYAAKKDHVYWREHYMFFISNGLIMLYLHYTVPCVIAARLLNRTVESRFANIVTVIDIFAAVIPLLYYCNS